MFERLRSDFHLAIIVLCGMLAVVAVLPFAVYRLVHGDYLIAAIDTVLLGTLLGASVHAWRSGRAAGAGMLISVVTTLGLIVVAGRIGLLAALWSYALLPLNFFIAPRGWSLVANAVLVVGLLVQPDIFATPYQAVTYGVTALLVTLFSFIIATRARLQREQLEALALHDTLTGAGNRRLMEVELRHALARFHDGHGQYGVALLDVDRFKHVNDRFGHEAGDAVLRQLAGIVRSSTRKFDQFYRFGGEEFVLLMPVGGELSLRQVLEKVHCQLRQRLHGPGGPVTVSIGAALTRPGESWSSWLGRADAALYRAKHAGRDCLLLDDSEPHAARLVERREAP